MAWISNPESKENKIIKSNSECFIRRGHPCGKLFDVSKSCFVACPNDMKLDPLISTISEKLAKEGIETNVAIKDRSYGQDIFCTKICGKIIESKFCIVILDEAAVNNQYVPNPNVYYEYGLMTSLGKYIIPLQKDSFSLAFNIQSHDTVKYSEKNLNSELNRAIKEAIKNTQTVDKEKLDLYKKQQAILRNCELRGLLIRDKNWVLNDAISDTGFKGFGQYEKNFYLILGYISSTEEMQEFLDYLPIVILRIEKKSEDDLKNLEEKKKSVVNAVSSGRKKLEDEISDISHRIELMKNVYIGFIVDESLETKKFIESANRIIGNNKRIHLSVSKHEEIVFDSIKLNYRREIITT